MAGTIIHDENLVEKHEKWIARKVSSKLFWTIITTAFLFTSGCWIYCNTIDKALAEFKVEQAKTVITKADLDSFKRDLFNRLDRMDRR